MNTNLRLQTKLDYDFSNYEMIPEAKLNVIHKNENMVKDVSMNDVSVMWTCDTTGSAWYKIEFYLDNQSVEFSYADKHLYLTGTGYGLIKDYLNRDDRPFYMTCTYQLLDYTFNEGNDIKYTLPEIIALINVVYKMIRNEASK
jgi:hypothetical protein